MNKLITTCIALFKVYIHRLYLKLLLMYTKTQQNNTSGKATKYTPRLPYGKDELEDYWE